MTSRLTLRRFAAAVTGLLVVGVAPVASAATTTSDVTEGTLDWGVKESFRSYVVSPVANGEIEMDGASQNSDGSYRFGGGTGTAGDGAAALAFSGSVRFTGHDGALDVTISNPGVQIDGSSGSLIGDVSSLGQDGEMAEFPGIVLADLDLSGVALEADTEGVVTASGVPATLSSAGAPAFGGFYQAGEALDPVSFTVQTAGGGQGTDGTVDNASDDGGTDGSDQGGAGDADETTGDAGTASQDEDALPKTGAPWQLVAVGGLVMVAIGTAFVLLGRRRVMGGARR